MEPPVVGCLSSVVEVFGPPGDTATEVRLAFQDVDGDATFGQTGGSGQTGDTRADDHDVGYLRQIGGVGQPAGCRMGDPV